MDEGEQSGEVNLAELLPEAPPAEPRPGQRPEETMPFVLIVEDETDLAELYASYIDDACWVSVAETGDEALKLIDHNLDIAYLDRRLDDWSGDELVNVIHERDIDCGIVMVTAVEPDLDIVDMPVDDYLTKPVFQEDLQRSVEEILFRQVGGSDRRELLALVSRKIALEREIGEEELAGESEYRKMKRRIRLAEERLDIHPVSDTSKHRPSACPECDLRWDVRVEGTVGYVEMGSRVWKCTRCGHVANLADPSDRRVARR